MSKKRKRLKVISIQRLKIFCLIRRRKRRKGFRVFFIPLNTHTTSYHHRHSPLTRTLHSFPPQKTIMVKGPGLYTEIGKKARGTTSLLHLSLSNLSLCEVNVTCSWCWDSLNRFRFINRRLFRIISRFRRLYALCFVVLYQ